MAAEEFSTAVQRDLLGLVLGKKLGEGAARRVYEFNLDTTKVVKIEDSAGSFQNICEWELWGLVQQTKWAKWFAACHHISACGTVLVQERIADAPKFPPKVPAFFTDLKLENFGLRGKQFVARDYGSFHARLTFGGLSERMIRVRGVTDGWAQVR